MIRNDQLELDYIEQTTRNVPAEAWLTIKVDSRPEFKVALDHSYRSINFFPTDIFETREEPHVVYRKYNTEQKWKNECALEEKDLQVALYKFDKSMFPHYVRTHDGNIGAFSFLENGLYPVYEFMNGERRVDSWELEHGADNINELKENFMSMQGLRSRMEVFIDETFHKIDPDLLMTARIKEGILSLMDKALSQGDLSMNELYEGAELFLRKNEIIEFVRNRQPEITPVPKTVVEHIKAYFEKELPGFTPVMVHRSSNDPSDSYLYSVVAQGASGKYACWSSWNESLQSMNHGHYNLKEEDAVNILKDTFYDTTDELALYGPENNRVILNKINELQSGARDAETQENYYAMIEKKHFGDPEKKTGIYADVQEESIKYHKMKR